MSGTSDNFKKKNSTHTGEDKPPKENRMKPDGRDEVPPMKSKYPPDSRLLKYAKHSAETFSVPISTKLTPSMNEAFLQVCQALNLTPAEVLRYLIEEELKVWEPVRSQKENEIASTKETIVHQEQPNRSPKDSNQHTKNPLKANGKTLCPICITWQNNLAMHLKKVHKTTKKEVFSDPKYKEVMEKLKSDSTAWDGLP